MSVLMITFIVIVAFLVLVLLEMPVGIALLTTGAVGVVLLDSASSAEGALRTAPFSSTAKFALVVIPMFSLMGALIANSGIGERIFRAANLLVGKLPGGLPVTTVLATTLFSGVSGSSAADVAAFGRISVNEMRRHGYRPEYAAAVVAAAGTFAVLIPPSVVLVVYGITAGVPVGQMLLAGLFPGIISCAVLSLFIIFHTRRHRPGARPGRRNPVFAVDSDEPAVQTGHERIRSNRSDLLGIVYAGMIFVVVIGGLYGGLFTSAEAGAMGALTAIFIVLLARRSAPTTLRRLLAASLRETVEVTSMIFLLLIGAAVFAYFLASGRLPADIAEWMLGLPVHPLVVIAGILLLMIPIGMFLDGLSTLLIIVPVVAPVVSELGYNEIWFGILVLKVIEIGLITPPVGLNVFVIAGFFKDIPVQRIFRSVLPFVVLDIAVTAVFFAFPQIVTWALPPAVG